MAQIRSKQIADFLSTVDWGTVATTDIANASAVKSYVDSEITALDGDASASVDSLEAALSAEIVATNSDVTRIDGDVSSIDTRAGGIEGNLNSEITRAESVEGVLSGEINTEKGRIDAILEASSADKDSFSEIVSLINAVDTENDTDLANVISDLNAEISATNGDVTSINTRATGIEGDLSNEAVARIDGDDSLEALLSAEIVATDGDFTTVNTRVSNEEDARLAGDDSLEALLSAEIVATDGDFTAVNTRVSNEEDARLAGDQELQASVDSIEAQLQGTSGDLDASVDSLEIALSAEISATNSDFVRVEDELSTEISTEKAARIAGDSSLEALLSAEISATNSDVTRIDVSVDSVETRLSIEEDRVTAILDAAEADPDSFSDVVSLINSVDQENDNVFAGYVTNNNASVDSLEIALANEISATNTDINGINASVDSIEAQLQGTSGDLDASVDSLEVALSAEISATNTDVEGINNSVDSLETALSAEIYATNSDVTVLEDADVSLETRISDVEVNIADNVITEDDFTEETFTGGGSVYTLTGTPANGFTSFDAFVNGVRVPASFVTGDVTLTTSYTIDSDDSVVIKYVTE